jgi:hypothetical protein
MIERQAFEKYERFKVGYGSLPSDAAHASEIFAWLFVSKTRKPPLPAIIVLHQTLPQGKRYSISFNAEPAATTVSPLKM